MDREKRILLNGLKHWLDINTECGVTGIPSNLLQKAIETLQEPPRPKGRWIKGRELADHEKGSYHIINDFIYCSNCISEAYWDTDYGQQEFDYCPYCGADMKGEEE